MLNATVGLIDIQQNKVIYLLSIVGVVLTPPSSSPASTA